MTSTAAKTAVAGTSHLKIDRSRRRLGLDRPQHLELEADRRLLPRREQEQLVGYGGLALELLPAVGAVGHMVERLRALGAVSDPERKLAEHALDLRRTRR